MDLSRLGIRTKVTVLSLVPIFVLVALCVFTLHNMSVQQANMHQIAEEKFPKAIIINHIRVYSNATLRFMWSALAIHDGKARREKLDTAREKLKEFNEQLAKFKTYKLSEKMQDLIAKIERDRDTFAQVANQLYPEIEKNNRDVDARVEGVVVAKLVPAMNDVIDTCKDAETLLRSQVDDEFKEIMADNALATKQLVVFSLVAIAALLALAVFVGRQTYSSLKSVFGTVDATTDVLTKTVVSIATSTAALTKSIQEQAAAVQQTVSAVEEISTTVQQTTERSNESKDTTLKSQNNAEEGKSLTTQLMTAMGSITESNGRLAQQLNQSLSSIRDISSIVNGINDKTKIINDIVFQTKLLSFNASVEAARAGEHGKGFAVVAEEIGNLASMSGHSAQEINTIIANGRDAIAQIVESIEKEMSSLLKDVGDKTSVGQQMAADCQDSLDTIVTLNRDVNSAMDHVARASSEQSRAIQEIDGAMSFLHTAMNTNSSSASSLKSAMETLEDQSHELKSAVTKLAEIVGGAAAA